MKKLVILFIILNLLYCITTYIGITQGLIEGNALLSFLFNYNIYLGLIIKMILAGAVILLLHLLKNNHLYKALNIAFTAIVIWNAIIILWR